MPLPADRFDFRDQFSITRKPTPQDITITYEGNTFEPPYNSLFHYKSGGVDHLYIFRGVFSNAAVYRRILDNRDSDRIVDIGEVASSTTLTGTSVLQSLTLDSGWNGTLPLGRYRISMLLSVTLPINTTATDVFLCSEANLVPSGGSQFVVFLASQWLGAYTSTSPVQIRMYSNKIVTLSEQNSCGASAKLQSTRSIRATVNTDTQVYVEKV